MSGKQQKGGKQPQGGNDLKFEFTPEMIKGIQSKLGGLIGQSSGYMESLPQSVQDRIAVLKSFHKTKAALDDDFHKELRALEEKYRALYNPLYDQRFAVTSGAKEPTADEIEKAKAALKEDESEEEENAAPATNSNTEKGEDIKGVPEFWLVALKHSELGDLITDKDADALKYLKDIRSRRLEDSPSSFALDFVFDTNPFFEQTTLTKTYILNESDVGPTMYDHAEGTDIKWKTGKNLTVKLVTKQQGGKRGGGRGGRRGGRGGAVSKPVTVEEPVPSFFHFFNPDAMLEDESMEEEEAEALLEEDYENGVTLKEEIIPNAVLWFTGEIGIDDDMMMFGEGEDDEDDDDEEDDESDDDAPPARAGGKKKGGAVAAIDNKEYKSDEDPDFVPDPNAPAQNPQNCNQQ